MKIFRLILFVTIIAAVLSAAIWFYFLRNTTETSKERENFEISQKSYANILFAGDMMFDRGIRYFSESSGNDFIFREISQKLSENDLVVANLEGSITNNKSISIKTIPGETNNYFFTFDPSFAKTIFENNIRIVDLGNNHILNFGYNGLSETEKYLDSNHVGYFNSPKGPKSVSTQINGIRITFVGYNEFSLLPEGVEKLAVINEIEKAKGFSDVIIVYCHWGAEYIQKPSEIQKKMAHEFIDNGADLVIGTHSHVIGENEIYKSRRIYYSLGNFVFDQYFNEDVRNGLGVEVKIDKQTKQMTFEEVKFYLNKNGQTILKQ